MIPKRNAVRSKAIRTVVATSLLGAGICIGVIAIGSAPAGAAHELCRVTAVDVTVHNKTSSSLPILSTRLGATNG